VLQSEKDVVFSQKRSMPEHVTNISETEAPDNERSYFDNHIYLELKSLIYGDVLSQDKQNDWTDIPSFESVVEMINSFELGQDIRIRVISETLARLLADFGEKPEKPAFLLSYLCRETVKNVILQKFNHVLGCECVDLLSLSHKIGDNIAEANKVFVSIRICDPAVRSGVFLQTILNELIAVKSQLGLLTDKEGNPLYQYKFITGQGGLFVLNKKDFRHIPLDGSTTESCRIQEALYDEKVALVQHCLFGVGAEQLQVLTGKLRLWLEIIVHLEGISCIEIPAIESNIIYGDALVSRFTLKDDLLVALKQINQTVADYKRLAGKIKTVAASSDRQYLKELMTLIQNRLIEGIGWHSKDTNELMGLRSELSKIMAPGLFPLSDREKHLQNERLSALQAKIKNQEQQMSTYRNHPAFFKAVEWRYVFPELLDDKGNFAGFDAMVGLLPDTNLNVIGSDKAGFYKRMNFKVYKRTGNVSDMFCELANRLLVYGGSMTYLMSSQWQRDVSNNKTGEFLVTEMNPLLLLLFDEIDGLKDKCAVIVQKDVNRRRTVLCRIDSSYHPHNMELSAYIQQYATPVYRLVEANESPVKESTPSIIISNKEYISIHNKIVQKGILIKNWDVSINSGITTGFDGAFVVDKTTYEELIHADYKNSEILKPILTGKYVKRYGDRFPEQWLLNIPWHFPMHYDKTINMASKRAEQRFQNQYPDVYAHLLKYKEELSSRYTNEVGMKYEWYALQCSGLNTSRDIFSGQKIIWKRESPVYGFGIDYGGCVVRDDVGFMTGQHLKFLLGVLNSSLGRYILSDLLSHESQSGIESIPVPTPNSKMESDVISLVNRRISENNKSDEIKALTEEKIDRLIYELYEINDKEIAFIQKP